MVAQTQVSISPARSIGCAGDACANDRFRHERALSDLLRRQQSKTIAKRRITATGLRDEVGPVHCAKSHARLYDKQNAK